MPLPLTDDAGVCGHGEAAPLPGYDPVTVADTVQGLEDCREVLEAGDGTDLPALLAACAARTVVAQALSAIDLALWDLEGRRRGVGRARCRG